MLPQYRDEFKSVYLRVLQGESIVLERTDGAKCWRFSFLPVHDEQRHVIGIAYNVQDITLQKEREQNLEERRQQLQKIIETIPHPLLITNKEGMIQYVNSEFEKVFGYAADEVLGRAVDFLIPERFRSGHNQLQRRYMEEGGKPIRMGRFLAALTKDSREITIDASLNSFTSNNRRFIVVILQDVTAQKKYQDSILQQNKILQDIAWQQSHNLRRPVANILGLCNLLNNYPNQTEEDKRQYVNYLNITAKELDGIIHKIVDATNSLEN